MSWSVFLKYLTETRQDSPAPATFCFHLSPKPFSLMPWQRSCFGSHSECMWGSLPTYSLGFFCVDTVNTEDSGKCLVANMLRAGRPPVLPNTISFLRLLPVGICHVGSCPCGNLWQIGSETFTSGGKAQVGRFISSLTHWASCHALLKGDLVGGLLRSPGREALKFLQHRLQAVGWNSPCTSWSPRRSPLLPLSPWQLQIWVSWSEMFLWLDGALKASQKSIALKRNINVVSFSCKHNTCKLWRIYVYCTYVCVDR